MNERLPTDAADEKLQRISIGHDVIEFRTASGRQIYKSIEEVRAFLKSDRQIDESLVLKRIPPICDPGDVVGYRTLAGRQYGLIREIHSDKSRGTMLVIAMLTEGPEYGVERAIERNDVESVMLASTWENAYGRSLPTELKSELPGQREDGTIDPGYLTSAHADLSRRRFAVVVERLASTWRAGGKGPRFERIFCDLPLSQAMRTVEHLREIGIDPARINVVAQSGDPLLSWKRRFLYQTPLGRRLLDILRRIPGTPYNRRQCTTAAGNEKFPYPTPEEANRQIAAYGNSSTLSAYFCRKHAAWHIGNT